MALFDIPDFKTEKQSNIDSFMTRVEDCINVEHAENRALAKEGRMSGFGPSTPFNLAGQAIMASRDLESKDGKYRLEQLEKGKSTGIGGTMSHSRWKQLQIYAKHKGVLETTKTPIIPKAGQVASMVIR